MDKLDHLGWVVSSSFAIGDVRFAVRSTSAAFGAWLSDALAAFEVDDVEDYLYSVVVPEPPVDGTVAKEFCVLYKGSSAIVRTLDPITLGRSMLAEIEALRFHEREDAVYVSASVMDVLGTITLVPASVVPTLVRLGKRATKLGIGIPGELTVAIDVTTASIVPARPSLDVPGDALERLAEACPWEGRDGLRFVREPESVRAFLVPARGGDVAIGPARKGYALANLAGLTLNLREAGGRGLETLGRFIEGTACYEMAWTDTGQVLTRFAEAVKETRDRA